MQRIAVVFFTLALATLAACASPGDEVPNWFDLDYKLSAYYHDRAQENGALCNLPDMTVTNVDIVESSGITLTLDVDYIWQDQTYGGGKVGGGNCFGADQRRFTVRRLPGGAYTVLTMSGPQRN